MTIPNGVIFIGRAAFSSNPLETLIIPPSLAIRHDYSPPRGIDAYNTFGDFWGGSSVNLTRITLPANMPGTVNLFEESFHNFYLNQNRAAGTYVKRGPIWIKE